MNAEKFSSTLNEVICELVADVLISNRLVIMLPKCILIPDYLRKTKGETSYDLYLRIKLILKKHS